MSRSNNTELINPATRFFEWNGEKGLIKYYDKQEKKQIELELPFQFLVLDCLSTITGFSDADNSGFWSNEVRDLKNEVLVVRNKKGKQFEGTYEQLQAANITGTKYCQSVYIMFKNEVGEAEIGNIKMVGSSLSAWIEFRKKAKIFDLAITITGTVKGKKGKTEYYMPVFETSEPTTNDNQIAIDMDKELQSYLKSYFAKNKDVQANEMITEAGLGKAVEEAHASIYGDPKNIQDFTQEVPNDLDLPF